MWALYRDLSASTSIHIIALDRMHGGQDRGQDSRVLLEIRGCLGVVQRPLKKRIALQEIRFLLGSKLDGVGRIFQGGDLSQTVSVLSVLPSFPREQDLINFEESLLIVDEKIQEIVSILGCKLRKLHSIFGQICELQQAVFEFFCFITVFIEFTNLLFSNDFSFKSSLNDISSDIFYAINKQIFKVSSLNDIINIFRFFFSELILHFVTSHFLFFRCVIIVSL